MFLKSLGTTGGMKGADNIDDLYCLIAFDQSAPANS